MTQDPNDYRKLPICIKDPFIYYMQLNEI